MRLIDADALLEAMKTDVMGGLNYRYFIEKAPTIEPKRGGWIKEYTREKVRSGRHIFRQVGYSCSNCGESVDKTYPNCPCCLSTMTVYNSMKRRDE